MNKTITQSKTHSRLSQAKSQKEPRNLNKDSLCIKNHSLKSINKQLAISKAEDYLSLTITQRRILDLLINMTGKYSNVVPAMSWIAEQIGCTVRTVVTATNVLHDQGYITKNYRGWFKVNKKKKLFISRPCKYKDTQKIKDDMKFLSKYLPKNSKIYRKLVKWIPALITVLCIIFTPTLKSSYNINKSSYIRRDIPTVFGQDNYSISKIYKDKEILPTTTLSKGAPPLILPKNHPANIHFEDDPYSQFKNRSLSISVFKESRSMENSNKLPKKGNTIDPRFCTASDYQSLQNDQQCIAHRYCRGRRLYGSVAEYEKELININKSDNIWLLNIPSDTILTENDVQLIKSLPQQVVYYLKQLLSKRPDRKNDMAWIMDACIARCKSMNIPKNEIRDLLRKHGYNYIHLLEPNKKSFIKRGRYPYKSVQQTTKKPKEIKGKFPTDERLSPKALAFLGTELLEQLRNK